MRAMNFGRGAALAVALLAIRAARADDSVPAFEPSGPSLTAKDFLAADQLSGPDWKVRDAVRFAGVFGTFEIESKFGLFSAPSLRIAQVRIREITVMERIAKKDSSDEFLKSLGDRLEQVPDGLVEIAKDPIGSVKDMGKGIEDSFGRVKDLFGKRKKTKYEGDSVEQALLASEKRKLAAELGVDVYSSNPKLQSMLGELAKARTAGKLTIDLASMALPGSIGSVKSVATFRDDAKTLLRDRTPAELDRINDDRLSKLGVAPYLRTPFLAQEWLSPRHKTLIVAALGQIAGTTDLGAFLSACLETRDEAQAFFHEDQAVILADHQSAIERLGRLDSVGGLVLAWTAGGRLVVPLPADRLSWSEEAQDLEQAVLGRPGVAEAPVRQLLVTGLVSERASERLRADGFVVLPRFAVPSPAK